MAKSTMATMKRRRQRFRMFVALFVVAVMAIGLGLGFYFGGRGTKTAAGLFDEGQRAFSEGRYGDAIKLYGEGLKLEPNSAQGYNLVGVAYRSEYAQTRVQGLRTKELEAFRKAVELNPGYVEALLNLGQTLIDTGGTEEGIAYLRKVLEINPNHPDRVAIEQFIQQAGGQ